MKLGELEVGDGRLIEGILADVPGEELITHTAARAKFHSERAAFHFGEAEKQRGMERDIPDGHGGKGSHTPQPSMASENAGKTHQHRNLFFAFLSKHFVKDKIYRLSVDDLSTLELGDAR